jgi:excisionase family DNA binding protein
MDKLYTTNQLAKLFGVVPTTVIDWIERGKLDAFKTLGGHRRITHQAVLDFLHRHRLPYPPAFADSAPKIVVLIADEARRAAIGELLQNDLPHAQVSLESRGAEALMRIGAERPRLVIFEAGGVAGFDCAELCRALRANPALASIKLLALGGEERREALLSAGADAFLEHSEAPQQMAATARALLAARPA